MLLFWRTIKQSLVEMTCLVVDVFTSGRSEGLQRTLILLSACSFFSLLLSSLLFLYLLFTLDYELVMAGWITGCFGTLLTIASFLSKRVRCMGTLFIISIFMKKSRNLLLTAGTSLVVLKNIRNTLENLTRLVRSIICNVRAKKDSIAAPFRNYITMLQWIGNLLKGITDLGIVNLDPDLKVSLRLESEKFKLRLSEVEQKLNETVRYVQALMETLSSVTNRMFPIISFLLLMMFIGLHIRKYRRDMKYGNRFISRKFLLFDEKQKAEGKPHVLPLTPKEQKLYASIWTPRPTPGEAKAALKFGAPVASHLVAWLLFITVDALLYFFVDVITARFSELEPFHVPLIMSFKNIATIIGISFSEEKDQRDFSYSVTLFEKKCLPEPKLLLYNSVLPLSAILFTLLIMAMLAAKVSRLRLMVCEKFFPKAAEERVKYLHHKILRKRSKTRKGANDPSNLPFTTKLYFWCPLIFQPKEEAPIEV